MHIAIYDPDYQLTTVFKSDAHYDAPTQREAAQQYFNTYCSDFCTLVEYPADMPLSEIPQEI